MAPMREPTYFILAALLDGPSHGYGIIQEAEALSGGRVRLTAGTLYGALERLTAEGLVEPDREDVVSGRRRRYFRLTGEGGEGPIGGDRADALVGRGRPRSDLRAATAARE